jgi:hypothetical protein
MENRIAFKYLARQKHSDGLAADESGSYQSVFYYDKIFKGKILISESENPLVACYHRLADDLMDRSDFIDIFRIEDQVLNFQEYAVPVVKRAQSAFYPSFLDMGDQAGGVNAAGD